MADGGASSFIFLTTALLVSGLVSVVLINQWGDMAQITAQETAALEVQEATSVDFAGDPMMVALDTTLTMKSPSSSRTPGRRCWIHPRSWFLSMVKP